MLTQLCFYLKAACFGLDNGHHQAKKYTIIYKAVKNAIYTTSCVMRDPTV